MNESRQLAGGNLPRDNSIEGRLSRASELAKALVTSLRPRQWLKNVLVLAAPAAAGVLTRDDIAPRALLAATAFCLVAGAMYLLNDLSDADADRLHPSKHMRPVAAHRLPVAVAGGAAAALLAAGAGLAVLVGLRFLAILGLYAGLTVAYSMWLKRVAVIDIAVVASGYLLRAIAGSMATGIPLSQWFLILVSFGALFVVAGKRHAELLSAGSRMEPTNGGSGAADKAPVKYTVGFLRYVWMLASAVAIAAYCLWAFSRPTSDATIPWAELSAIPFVLTVLRYGLLLDAGRGGAPEDVLLSDGPLIVLVVIWVLVYAAGVYVAR